MLRPVWAELGSLFLRCGRGRLPKHRFGEGSLGGGPSGLSAAIRAKQLDTNLNVVVLDKGSEIGAHILSGAVLDPIGIDKLIPEWKKTDIPIKTKVTEDNFFVLGPWGQPWEPLEAEADPYPYKSFFIL